MSDKAQALFKKEDLAALLQGREYGSEITTAEEAQAKAAGLIVIFGYSDDSVELRGAVHDEIGMYGGGEFSITSEASIIKEWDADDAQSFDAAREYFRRYALLKVTVNAEWSPSDEEMSWRYVTNLPHATFDAMEDGEVYCRGIVIAVADIAALAQAHV